MARPKWFMNGNLLFCMTEKQAANGILEDFRLEFAAFWGQLPNKGFFLVLLVAWLALFQFLGNCTFGYVASPSLLQWMYEVYKPFPNPDMYDDSHARIIPFLVLGLFWWKRKELTAQPLRTWGPGLVLVAAALLLHLAGYAVQQPRLSIVALFTGIYGLMGIAWGPAWLRACFFPFWLFIFCVPLGTLALPITFPLRQLVCRLVEGACHYLLAIEVVRDGTLLYDPTGHYRYDVAPACSGMRSLIATLAIAIVYAMLSFRAWWRRGLLMASAFPLAVLGNFLRMLAIIVAAEMGGQTWGNWVHDGGPFGIISLMPYIPAFGGLLLLGHWLREAPRKPAAGAAPTATPSGPPVPVQAGVAAAAPQAPGPQAE
jgi:exosortase